MQVFKATKDLRNHLRKLRMEGRSIGLVPTMGALHDGHMSLLAASKEGADVCVCSIFVNPTQFNNKNDFDKYPRNSELDLELLQKAGCDVVFIPEESEVYTGEPRLSFDSGYFGEILEGKFRPGHFNGVLLVVSKLFNLIQPDLAYFGQKDLQQLILIRQMVKDLSFPIRIISVPTVREKSGLAMSSRNKLLSKELIHEASCLFGALELGKAKLLEGEGFDGVRLLVEDYLRKFATAKLEYYELLDIENLELVEHIENGREYALVVAAYFDGVRLIDNLVFEK